MPKMSGKYANKGKSGSTSVRNYDPKNTHAGGASGKPAIASKNWLPKNRQGPNNPGR